jgi:hypothetical protein
MCCTAGTHLTGAAQCEIHSRGQTLDAIIIIIIITRVSSQVHRAQSNKSTMVQDKQVTTRPSETTIAPASLGRLRPSKPTAQTKATINSTYCTDIIQVMGHSAQAALANTLFHMKVRRSELLELPWV